jgi:gliding motility-associated-like protein
VSNHSFESGNPICGPTNPSDYLADMAFGWTAPNDGTTDIYSTTLPDNCFGKMPNPGRFPPNIGTQLPRTGERCAGIYTGGAIDEVEYTWREYLQTELITPLEIGQFYKVTFYISLAEESAFATNNIGIAFGTYENYFNTHSVIPIQPKVVINEIVLDSVNWVEVSGYFKADQAYTHMIIGNFSYDYETTRIPIPFPDPNIFDAYYFIDDVSLVKVPCPPFNFLGDTMICKGDSLILSSGNVYENIHWTTLEDTASIITTDRILRSLPSQTTSYRIVSSGDCSHRIVDTVTVFVKPQPILNLGDDKLLCDYDEYTIQADPVFHSYKWQDDSSLPNLKVSESGTYSVEVLDEYGCDAFDEISIAFNQSPKARLGNDTTICTSPFILTSSNEVNSHYLWSTGATEQTISVNASGYYWVKVTNECGTSSDTVRVVFPKDIFIPNIITVNGDEMHDDLTVLQSGKLVESEIKIFNRWGKQVFSSSRYAGTWPGSDERTDAGTYYYVCSFGECVPLKGWVHIIK